ncbi:hypothetical protein DGG96_02490 [Legionella qingyii]|uniref:Uncharacterized protein n=1 Tax=Legionella qingyii TaxID=2184757 RepID=A0A317U5A9_9GAMM|nr:hypothetical protein [Legionella qingyii]PWY56445.1 hypothetical protein DGG96_06700 [Legionella qingyii]PWY57198.1 hypothetical protein DGG96_02490 [Legionella qingyii]RUR24963.1 hypothetical protein ELY20_04190 [Legionella qingyii]RUR28765.1 hypothetical protein ELY16_01790 [Legionella qingyii]
MMMLIIDNEINKDFVKSLSKEQPESNIVVYKQGYVLNEQIKDNKLFIVDLMADIPNVHHLFPDLLAHELIINKLPASITDIYLIVTFFDNVTITSFANRLASALREEYKLKISVHVLARLGHDQTKLSFKHHNGLWKVYGENNKTELTDQGINQPIWEGTTLMTYLDHQEQIYTGVSFAWSFQAGM